ncbi:probable G-protein coupled receptor 82 [Prionailurus viverrinus]|uniref:G-protein coupled receptors family 1 profile domain-containing protein n=4 Tax=Felinae TaxID=338152 RepID=A0ABI7VUA3_FELCA|nr:probable G-protein coupled receptor 82 [Felis catus]XP_025790348.1 probable G-protein coupled receptor 82 [Puma concolor]XP_026909742.1 probable G-protein coupled receptor 82 [Acinonyx jubatus]XP_032447931.1 probable G-protein coupled receptor 82 [Lynx canadensis]XP_040324934.1 probable G-protein coupled receptor 82 [Puma yagouaroundi]XP_043426107.1 probable G-protein coupled receptor 82 [Prionailurus bengalensis]XP_044906959.1 probable G-protein coupled receptor 82 [Felis catus]XP_046932
MNNNSTCIQPSRISSMALPIIYTFLCIIGLFGNSLSQWVFLTKIGKKTSTHIYLAHLVTANLLVCSAMPFMGIYFLKGFQWEYRSARCTVVNFLGTLSMHVSMFVSVLILSWIAISRYATLMKKDSVQETTSCYERVFYGHLLKKFRQPNFARKLCVYIWGVVLGIIIPVIIYYSVVEATKGEENVCYNRQTELGAVISQTAGLIGTTFIGFSFLVVLTSYYSFVSHLRKIRTCTSITEKDLTYNSVKRHLLVIQVLLIVCFLPYSIFKPIFYVLHQRGNCQQLNYLIEIKNILTCLASARSSTDPIIFLFLDKTFKKTLYNLFTKSDSPHIQPYS